MWIKQLKGNMTMNKLLVALGLAATVALVGCNKDKAPETGATTGEHLENAADQAGHDIANATSEAATATAERSGRVLRGVPRKADGDPEETRVTEEPHQCAAASAGLLQEVSEQPAEGRAARHHR